MDKKLKHNEKHNVADISLYQTIPILIDEGTNVKFLALLQNTQMRATY